MNKGYPQIINGKNVVVLSKKEIDSITKQDTVLTLRILSVSKSSRSCFIISISSLTMEYIKEKVYGGFVDVVRYKLKYNNDRSYIIEEIPRVIYRD